MSTERKRILKLNIINLLTEITLQISKRSHCLSYCPILKTYVLCMDVGLIGLKSNSIFSIVLNMLPNPLIVVKR